MTYAFLKKHYAFPKPSPTFQGNRTLSKRCGKCRSHFARRANRGTQNETLGIREESETLRFRKQSARGADRNITIVPCDFAKNNQRKTGFRRRIRTMRRLVRRLRRRWRFPRILSRPYEGRAKGRGAHFLRIVLKMAHIHRGGNVGRWIFLFDK